MVKMAERDLYTFYGFLQPPTTFSEKHPPGGENHPYALVSYIFGFPTLQLAGNQPSIIEIRCGFVFLVLGEKNSFLKS